MKKQEWAYAAGIFDGEGSVSITKDKDTRHYLRATVTNTCEFLCFWLEKKFAGSFVPKPRRVACHKPCFTWTITGKRAQHFLQGILPYCLIKQQQIEVALTYPVKAYSIHCTKEEKELREELYLKLKGLNK